MFSLVRSTEHKSLSIGNWQSWFQIHATRTIPDELIFLEFAEDYIANSPTHSPGLRLSTIISPQHNRSAVQIWRPLHRRH
jgi:hypothetical protein